MFSSNDLTRIDVTPWEWDVFRQTKDSDPTLLRKFECWFLEQYEERLNRRIVQRVTEVANLDYLYLRDEPTLTQYARLCKVSDTLGLSHAQVEDALAEVDRLAEAS